MRIETSIIIAALSLAAAIYFGVAGIRRNKSKDDKHDAAELTTVIVKLENISTGISDIKANMRNVETEVKELRDRVTRAEDSAKSAHRRIDELHFKEPTGSDSGL